MTYFSGFVPNPSIQPPCNLGIGVTSVAQNYSTIPLTIVGAVTNVQGLAVTSITKAITNVGDLVVLIAKIGPNASAPPHINSLTGGNVANWVKLYQGVLQAGANFHNTEIWIGRSTGTGSVALTLNLSSSSAGIDTDLSLLEFNAPGATAFQCDGVQFSTTSSTTTNGVTLNPSTVNSLYVGYIGVTGVGTSGGTAGFTYFTTADTNFVVYNPTFSASGFPAATQAPTGGAYAFAAVIRALETPVAISV